MLRSSPNTPSAIVAFEQLTFTLSAIADASQLTFTLLAIAAVSQLAKYAFGKSRYFAARTTRLRL
jgi:hypothetical protein